MQFDVRQLPPVHEAWLPREHPLHRPRHGGKQLIALACAVIFFATPTVAWLSGARPAEIENRPLASLAGPSRGWEMFTALPAWATDNLVLRSSAIDAADAVSRNFFRDPAPQGEAPLPGPLPGITPDLDGNETPETPVHAGFHRVIEGKDGWLYLGEDVRSKCRPERTLDSVLRSLRELRDIVESSGRKFVLVVAPDKSTMVPEYLPDTFAGKQCARAATARFWPRMLDEGGAIDLRPDLQAAAQRIRRPVYFAQDTHWTHAGALMFTRAVAETVQPGVAATWKVVEDAPQSGRADLPPMIGKTGMTTVTTYQLRPDGVTNRRVTPPRTGRKPARITSSPIEGTVNQRTLLLGDSFSYASAAYFGAAFTDLTVASYATWPRGRDVILQEFVEADVVVVEIVERAAADGIAEFLGDDFRRSVREALAAHPR